MAKFMVISLVLRIVVIIALFFVRRFMTVNSYIESISIFNIKIDINSTPLGFIQKILNIFIGAVQTAIFVWLVVDVVRLIRA